MLTDGKRAAVPQHGIGGMKHVCGIKSRGRLLHVTAITSLTSK